MGKYYVMGKPALRALEQNLPFGPIVAVREFQRLQLDIGMFNAILLRTVHKLNHNRKDFSLWMDLSLIFGKLNNRQASLDAQNIALLVQRKSLSERASRN